MLSRATQPCRHPTGETRVRGTPRLTPKDANRATALLIAVILILVLSSASARAGTFPVLQEQVRIGATTGIAGAQAVDGLRETLTEADVASNLTTAPSAENVTVGSAIGGTFPADVASADGVYARYREATPGPVTSLGNPGTTLSGCTWTACDSGRLPDNVSASSAVGGDVANYSGFTLSVPASAAILAVSLGFEAFDPTGNDHLSGALSWDGGITWCPPALSGGLPPADPNAYTFLNVTACTGHTWSPADFGASLTVRFTHVVLGGVDTIDLDANAVRVTYQPFAYQLSMRYDWSGVPSGVAYALALTGHISNDSVSVELWTPPASWTPRLTINATTDVNLSYTLAPSEIAAGNVSIRFVDASGSSPTPSDLWIDLAAVVSVRHLYRLDVVQNVTGITGASPRLTVQGNVSATGGNFDVFVWDFSVGSWTAAWSAPFTATEAAYSLALTAGEVSNGTVRLDFREQSPPSSVPATLTLDFVGVETTDAAAAFPWTLVLPAVLAAVVVLGLVVFFVILPRRKPSEPDAPKEASSGPAESSAPLLEGQTTAEAPMEASAVEAVPAAPIPSVAVVAARETCSVPVVDAADLVPGGAYLIEEDEPGAALRVLEALTRIGRSGFVLTRRSSSAVESFARLRHTTLVVLGEAPDAIEGLVERANQTTFLSLIREFLRTNPVGVVLFDGELAGPEGFAALAGLVQAAAASVSRGQQILLVSASSRSLSDPGAGRLREGLEPVRVSLPPPRPVALLRK